LCPEDPSGQITELLRQWTQGDEKALTAVAPLVYKELRRPKYPMRWESRATVDRDWATARVWLYRQMRRTAQP